MKLVKISFYHANVFTLIQNVLLVYNDEHYFGYISPNATRPEDLMEIKKSDIENLVIEEIN